MIIVYNGDDDDGILKMMMISYHISIALTEQSIPENSGSQTQVLMLEHFWGRNDVRNISFCIFTVKDPIHVCVIQHYPFI